ncbi:MAG: hypothetical protein JO345_11075 [Streptosporangiaceae bacterium]|nr:hypothetical protein [Streptosporangiaceae bacterium]
MLTGIGWWLRQQREARSWARREMARRLTQAAEAAGDTTLPGIEHLETYIRRWESGRHQLTERYRIYYCTAFGIRAGQFGTAPLPQPKTPGLEAEPRPDGDDPDDVAVGRDVVMAAHDGTDLAEQAEQHRAGGTTLEQLRADVRRLARLSDTGQPAAVFADLRRVRDRTARLLTRRLPPPDQASLYFVMGCLGGLMGNTADRLGYPDAAEELVRSGWAYADPIAHEPLRGQLRTVMSSLMCWRGRFDEARELALDGLRFACEGRPGAWLYLRLAGAAAGLGDAAATRQAIRDAGAARDQEYSDELVQMGGQFALSRASYHRLAGAALAGLEGAGDEAGEELERAIGLYDEGLEDHWFAGKPLASIDLALVRLRSGALDFAALALEPALSLPVALRIAQVTTGLGVVRGELAAPIYRGSAQARDLDKQIEEFTVETMIARSHGQHDGGGSGSWSWSGPDW